MWRLRDSDVYLLIYMNNIIRGVSMIIKNETSSIVELKYYDRLSPEVAKSICIRPYGEVELETNINIRIVSDLASLQASKIISIVDPAAEVITPEEPAESSNEEEEFSEEQDESNENVITEDAESDNETEDSEDTTYKCEVCGREFASSRGLSTHMKSHNN